MTTCLIPTCADQATRTWSAVSLATVDASVVRFVATAIAPSLDREKERPPGRCPAVAHRARPRLVPAGSDLDGGFLEARADDVRARRLQRVGGLLRQIGPERAVGGLVLQHLVGRRDVHGLVPRRLVQHADAVGRRPDERVDLVQLPRHVALAERRSGLEHDVDALALVVTAEYPAFERGLEKFRCDVLVA